MKIKNPTNGSIEPHYLINKTSIKLFSKQFSSQKVVQELIKLKDKKLYDKDEFLNLLNKNKIFTTLSSYIRFYLRCFCAIAAFKLEELFKLPIISSIKYPVQIHNFTL